MARATTLYLCQGSSCRKHKKDRKKLLALLDDDVRVETVKCQDICKGFVVGLDRRAGVEWFRRVDSGKVRRAVAHLSETGSTKVVLEKRRVIKRSGKIRG